MGGLDVYSGYWLATDSPANGIEDALQEEGIDTLRRVMEAAGINFYNENGVLCSENAERHCDPLPCNVYYRTLAKSGFLSTAPMQLAGQVWESHQDG